MKVIFIKDLKKQGKVNDVKEVSDGYALNFLIKNGYAIKYTKTSSNILERELKENERIELKNIEEAKKIKDNLEKENIIFKVKCKNGKVFGSISSKQISDLLTSKGYKIEKKNIKLESNLNILGFHKVKIVLYKKVEATVNIELVEE